MELNHLKTPLRVTSISRTADISDHEVAEGNFNHLYWQFSYNDSNVRY